MHMLNQFAFSCSLHPRPFLTYICTVCALQKLFLATHWELIDERGSGSLEAAAAASAIVSVLGGDGEGGSAVGGEGSSMVAQAEAIGQSAVHSYVRPPGAANVSVLLCIHECLVLTCH